MDKEIRQIYIDGMENNLPMLRAKLGLTQKDLADIIGVSAFTILAIEKGQRKMTWNTFLSLLLVFMNNDQSKKILNALNILDDQLMNFIERRKCDCERS